MNLKFGYKLKALSNFKEIEPNQGPENEERTGMSRSWDFLAGACIMFLLFSLIANIYNFNTLQNTKKDLLNHEHSAFEMNQAESKGGLPDEHIQFISSPETKKIMLRGQQKYPDSKAVVYWHPENNMVFVDGSNLPKPPSGKIYQLWSAKTNSKGHANAGLLKLLKIGKQRLIKMNNVSEAAAFVITLEPAKGSQTPTLEELVAHGEI